MNQNKVFLIGRVTKAPETKALQTGTTVTKFTLATNNVFKSKDGTKNETAQFHNCVSFGKVAETIAQYVERGQELQIEGRIEYRSWEKKDGTMAYMTEIIVEGMQFGQKAKAKEYVKKETEQELPQDDDIANGGEEEINPEDLPF